MKFLIALIITSLAQLSFASANERSDSEIMNASSKMLVDQLVQVTSFCKSNAPNLSLDYGAAMSNLSSLVGRDIIDSEIAGYKEEKDAAEKVFKEMILMPMLKEGYAEPLCEKLIINYSTITKEQLSITMVNALNDYKEKIKDKSQ